MRFLGTETGETEMNETLMKTEYSKDFDEKRKGLIEQSYYKYGPARMNFANGNVDAIESLKRQETSNTCVMLQTMPCSGLCFHNKENISNIQILMNLPGFSV